MSSNIQARGRAYQLRVRHRLLPKPFFATFDSHAEAQAYGDQMESLLAAGVVPQELLTPARSGTDRLLIEVVRLYTQTVSATASDDELLRVIIADRPVVGVRLSGLTFGWVDAYVRWLKGPEKHLVPGSIRKRIGTLARVLDWYIRQSTALDAQPMANPLRLLPRGYSTYSKADAAQAPARFDTSRDRRLGADDDARIRAALSGVKRPDRQRALAVDAELALLYGLIVDTGMRLSEAYRLRVDQIDLAQWVIRVAGSKGHRGQAKPRVVPVKVCLRAPLRAWCTGRVGLLFGFWDGAPESLRQATRKLSARFAALFDYAGVVDFSEHDLRHEAACRWFELRDGAGRWVFSEVEVCRIMGWSDPRMALRYASLRGEDLAARLG